MLVAVAIVAMLVGSTTVAYMLTKPEVDEYERTTILVQVVVSLKNLGNSPATNIPLRLGLPMELPPSQHVEWVEFSEPPVRRTNDSWGNRYAHYIVDMLTPKGEWVVTFLAELELTSIDWSVEGESVGEFGPEVAPYLEESFYINYNDPAVFSLAHDIAGRSADVQGIAWNTYDWVVRNIFYQQIPGEADAATTLRNGEGGSAEFANLFVALMRANGLPARRVSGWGYHFAEGDELSITRFAHGWAEFYLPRFGWLPVDPTWGQASKYDNFAKADGSHVTFTLESGNHFLQRGAYDEPFGPTDVRTDYVVIVHRLDVENLSLKRDIISVLVLAPPAAFAAFVGAKGARQRRVGD